jgi:hypothetical protein
MRLLRFFSFLALAAAMVVLTTRLTSINLGAHPIHVTVLQMDYNPKSQALELAFKIFADDFESAVNKQNNVMLRLGSERELPNAANLLYEYIKRHFSMSLNGKPVASRLVGKEIEGEAVWVYVEVPSMQALGTKGTKNLTLQNTLLFDVYDDQSNLVNMSLSGQRKSAIFRKGKEIETVTFE